MNRESAKQLAETTTTTEIKQMLNNALGCIEDWNRPSASNSGINLSQAIGIFFNAIDSVEEIDEISKTNMIHCFGDYLPLKMSDVVDYDIYDDSDEFRSDLPF